MGQSLGELYAELALKTDKLQKGISESNRSLAKLEQDIDNAVDSINAKLAAIGAALSASVTLPLTLLGKAALDTFTNFEQSMQNTFSVMGATASEMEALRKKAEEMGASTRFSASQAADALYSLGSAGQSATQAMNSLDGVLQLAGATGSDLAFTSSTIASTLSQFNLQAEKSGHIADVFSLAISKSQANMTKLSYSMKYVGPVAAGLGVSLETSTAALMRLYNTGFGGEQAGTILRSGLQKLASGTDDVKKKLQELGVSYDEVNPKTNNLADIIERLKNANIDVAKSSELFGEAAAAGMQALIEGGGDAIRTMDGLLQASDGAAKKMQDIQNASFANTKAELSSAFEAIQITLTSNIIPAVDTFAKGITRVLQFVNELPVGVQTAGTALAGLAAAAGPLLLVAIGIKKIKSEMVQLNLVMSANPIIAWGAAVAAAGAIALGIIAQVKKAHEDYIHGAKRSVEEVKKLKEDALKQGNEGRKIQSLFDEYNTLKDKTQKTADEQARYNNLLKELQEIVPGAVEGLDEQGRAVAINEEKITQAVRSRLEREKVLNDMALTQARIRKQQAEIVAKTYEGEEKSAFAALNKKQDYVAKLDQFYTKVIAFDRNLKENNKKEVERLRAEILRDAQTNNFNTAFAVFRHGDDGALEHTKNYLLKQNDLLTKEREAYKKIVDIKNEQAAAIQELNDLTEKGKQLNQALDNLNNPTETKPQQKKHDEELARLAKEWEAEKKIIDEKNRYAQKMGESFSIPTERIKFLQAKLKELIAIKPEDIDKIFTLDSKGLQEYFDAIAQEQAKLEKGKGTKKASNKEKDTSYQAQIAELDKFYQEKLARAKEYGQSSLAVEKEYQEKRLALIEQFIKEEDKKKGAGKGITVETKLATKDEKGSGVTLGDELTKTKLMNDAFGRYQIKQKELQEELKKTQEEIQKTKALLEGEKGAVSSEEATQAKQYLKDLQEEANKLEIALGQSKYSLSQIDEKLKNLDTVGKSDFHLSLINIEAERKKAHEVLAQARQNGEIHSDEELTRYKTLADKKAAIAKTSLVIGIVNGVLGIADTLSSIVAGAIEQGGIDGVNALKSAGGIVSQIGSLIPGIGGMVTGLIGSAIGMASSVVGIFQKRAQKITQQAREDAKKFNDEIKRQQEENIRNAVTLTGEVVKNIAKLQAGKKLNSNIIFDSQALEIEKKRIDGVLEKVKDLKTEATYTYQQKRTRKIDKWYDPLDWFHEEETYYTTETAQLTVAEVMEKYNAAMRAGDYEMAKKWRDFAQRAIEKGLKDAGVSSTNIDPLSNYIGNLDSALAGYVKTRNMKDLKKALQEQLYEALVNKAVKNTISQRIAQVFDKVGTGEITYEEGLKKIEDIGKEAGKIFDDMNKHFGLSAEAAKKEWEAVGSAIVSSLTNALGDAAYNADWASFKKSFASEMKKAIIQAAIENAGIKQKVDAIIQDIMKDGKITGDEVTGTIDKLKNLYDNLEGNMAELSKITKALEGGVELKSKASGSIIQQLSGADRDVLLEAIREGFKTINQVIDLKETAIQHLTATQIIINSVTYTSYYSTINITATEQTDLRAVLTEIVQQALAG
ncbi:phage tail tape measure protein [Treponema sp. OMZ 857]|uniref:phage tail tape measure protein n=1 Tax=Treponema sp. OMZ 857 TaxID=1643513 RepID=UPI0020A3B92C|nr:phage tail tape measure protein [Treponema sp. OMZ 857]UTC44866.1 phage tail tape measure protein [Treponema sp. OMZ 857]